MTILEGTISKEGEPLEGAYVRLIGPSGEYVSERRTLEDGAFRFNIVPGSWEIKWFLSGGRTGTQVLDLREEGVRRLDIEVYDPA